jgi:hypothetical protein
VWEEGRRSLRTASWRLDRLQVLAHLGEYFEQSCGGKSPQLVYGGIWGNSRKGPMRERQIMTAISLASSTSIHVRPHMSIHMHRGIPSLYSTFSIRMYLDVSSINFRGSLLSRNKRCELACNNPPMTTIGGEILLIGTEDLKPSNKFRISHSPKIRIS